MTTLYFTEWSLVEQEIAKAAFQKAYEQEVEILLSQVRERSAAIASLDDLWFLHDFLSTRRHDIDGKYDYRHSELIFTFARLVKEGWLAIQELEGIDKDKLTKIKALSRM